MRAIAFLSLSGAAMGVWPTTARAAGPVEHSDARLPPQRHRDRNLLRLMLGMMSGAAAMPPVVRDCGLLILAFDPGLLGPVEDYKARVAAYAEAWRGTRPIDPAHKVRLPFERLAAERTRRLAANRIEVANPVYQALRHVSRATG